MKRKYWRHFSLNLRRMKVTFVGDEGKPWRVMAAVLAGILLLTVLLMTSAMEPQLMSTPEILSVQEKGTLRVGVRYDIGGLGSKEGGLTQELAALLAERVLGTDAESSLQLVEVTSMTGTTQLDDGSVDVVIALMDSRMASRYFYSHSYYTDPCRLVAKKGIGSFTLNGATIGYVQSNPLYTTIEDYLLSQYMDENSEVNLIKKKYASYPDMLDGLTRGEVDAVVMTGVCVEKYSEKYEIAQTEFSLGDAQYAVMCASDTTVFAQLADLMLDELKESGQMDALYQKYGLSYRSSAS